MERLSSTTARPDYAKWTLFGVLGIVSLYTLVASESYLLDPHSRHWNAIAPFKWILMPHAILGLTALVLGPLQFSSRIRRARPQLHRLIGRIYVSAVAVAAPVGAYIGATYMPYPFNYEQPAQGGVWFLTTAIAFLAIRKKNVALHRQWMARSYAFTFFFILSRVPLITVHLSTNPVMFATVLWYLMVATLIAPDLILNWPQLWRRPSAVKAQA